jgi:hypothetical protein
MDAIWPLVGVALGALLTYLFGRFSASAAAKREDARAEKADAQRLAAKGREHAARALEVIRPAREASWKRTPEHGSADIETDDLNLDLAEAEIDLIPDPVLRPRLAGVLNVVRYPWALANSSYTESWPIETQREGLYLLREALAAYVREEPTPTEPDRLAALAKANDDAHQERSEWEADRLKEEKEAALKKSSATRKPAIKKKPR